MAHLQQGTVVWADQPPPLGRRPVVILTRDRAVGKLNALTVGPISRTIRNVQTEVILEPADGLPTTCAVNLDSIFTSLRSDLGKVITVLDRSKLLLIFAAIRIAFDMP
jgi:mRNA interferase MazF